MNRSHSSSSPGENISSSSKATPLLQQTKQQHNFSEAVENILHKNLSLSEQTEFVDYCYINNIMMDYFYFGSKLKELKVLFPDIYEKQWLHIQNHVENLRNIVFSGGSEPDEIAMLEWYYTNGEKDVKIVQDAVNLILTKVIDTYQDHPTVGLAYMLLEEFFPGHMLPASGEQISRKPKFRYKEIFPD